MKLLLFLSGCAPEVKLSAEITSGMSFQADKRKGVVIVDFEDPNVCMQLFQQAIINERLPDGISTPASVYTWQVPSPTAGSLIELQFAARKRANHLEVYFLSCRSLNSINEGVL